MMKRIHEFLSPWLQSETVDRLLIITVSILVILLILYYAKKAISKHVDDNSKKYRARKVSNVFAYLLIVIAIVFTYSDKLGNIGVAVGLAGAGIAFALQEVITSFAGWISIIFTNQVKVGQRVKIDKLRGDIIDISVLKTTLMEVGDWVDGDLYNGRITTISNSFIFKTAIQNYSADYPFLWDEITVPIRTSSDFKLAKKVFSEVTSEVCGDYAKASKSQWASMQNKYQIENAQVEPMVTLKFDENWITFTIRYVVDYRRRRITKDILFTRYLEEIAKNDDSIKIATTATEVTNVTPEKDNSHLSK